MAEGAVTENMDSYSGWQFMVVCMTLYIGSLQGSPSLTLTRRYKTDRFCIAPVLRSCVLSYTVKLGMVAVWQ